MVSLAGTRNTMSTSVYRLCIAGIAYDPCSPEIACIAYLPNPIAIGVIYSNMWMTHPFERSWTPTALSQG
jgi:hypothetical protein